MIRFPGIALPNKHINNKPANGAIGHGLKSLSKSVKVAIDGASMFVIRTANKCLDDAKEMPIPRMLFSELWHEGELSILFADTNLGKSILAVQIADAISKGVGVSGFKLEAARQKVLYYDYEMSTKQFEHRYSNDYAMHYRFDEYLYRIELNPDFTCYEDFEERLKEEMIAAIVGEDIRVLIIDNLTYLKTGSTDTAKEALPLMKMLKELKQAYNLSLLVLAHTPKRDGSKPISKNDLAGSKQLANFADSIFALGESYRDKSLRYIKQIKARATQICYDGDNVIVVEITKPSNFLGFEFRDFGHEAAHLRIQRDGETEELEAAILRLKDEQPLLSCREIATQLNTYAMKVQRVLARAPTEDTGGNSRTEEDKTEEESLPF